MKHIMIVANQTSGGSHLRDIMRQRAMQGPCRFTLLVPATPPHDHLWTDDEARGLAHKRLDQALKKFGELQLDIKGVVGDANVVSAINDLMLREEFDEIILSTLPPGISRWIGQDLPNRVSRRFHIPVTHVIASRDLVTA
ncbi:MAG: hypothetical protein ACLGHL_09330 [Actinomycetota bacterium]